MPEWLEILTDRTVFSIFGEDAEHFLENLVTCKVSDMQTGDVRFGALLTPQGKIMFDFFLIRHQDTYLLDTAAVHAEELAKRLMFYKLRAKVEITAMPEMMVAAFEGKPPEQSSVVVSDPRHPKLGQRAYGNFVEDPKDHQFDHLRVELGVPEGGKDFEYGDAYPHEALMDQFGGVDFKKGCYVGQEVVSRMQHKTVVRKRAVKLSSETDLPETGTPVLADGKPAGTLGTVLGRSGLAILRLDRIHKAETVDADDIPLNCTLPDWVKYTWPEIN